MNYYSQYQQNHIETASPEQILIMLYDGALRFIRQARQGLAEQDLKAKIEGIGRSIDILNELSNTLDFEKGGELADNLDGLYAYMVRELTLANARNASEPLDIVENILEELKDGWIQAIEKHKAEQHSAVSVDAQKQARVSAAA
jgi:flagellar protein FliS